MPELEERIRILKVESVSPDFPDVLSRTPQKGDYAVVHTPLYSSLPISYFIPETDKGAVAALLAPVLYSSGQKEHNVSFFCRIKRHEEPGESFRRDQG